MAGAARPPRRRGAPVSATARVTCAVPCTCAAASASCPDSRPSTRPSPSAFATRWARERAPTFVIALRACVRTVSWAIRSSSAISGPAVAERHEAHDLELARRQRRVFAVTVGRAAEARAPARGAERDEQHQVPPGHDLDGCGPLHRDRAAVGRAHLGVAGELPRAHVRLPFGGRGDRPADDELVDRSPDHLGSAVAEELQVGAVGIDLAPGAVEQHHRVARLRERSAEQPAPVAPLCHRLRSRCWLWRVGGRTRATAPSP